MPARLDFEKNASIQNAAKKLVSELEAIDYLQSKVNVRTIGLVSILIGCMFIALVFQVTFKDTDSIPINPYATGIAVLVMFVASFLLSKNRIVNKRGTSLLCLMFLLLYLFMVWINKSLPVNFLPALIGLVSVLAVADVALVLSLIAVFYSAIVLYDPSHGVSPLVASRILFANAILLVLLQLLTRHYKKLVDKTLHVTSGLKDLSEALHQDLEVTTLERDIARETDLESGVLNGVSFDKKFRDLLKLRLETSPIALIKIEIAPVAHQSLIVLPNRFDLDLLGTIKERITEFAQGGLVGRTSKWEFVATVDIQKSKTELTVLTKDLLHDLRGILRNAKYHLSDQVYMGAAIWSDDGHSADEILNASRTALAFAQLKQILEPVWHRPEMHSELSELRHLVDTIDEGITSNQFYFEYQPVVSVSTHAVEFYECLVRWRHPTLGLLSPNKFIPLAIKGGQIVPLTIWSLRKVANLVYKMNTGDNDLKRFSVNIAPTFLEWSIDHPNLLKALLDDLNLVPNSIILEITEESFLGSSEKMLTLVDNLKDQGFLIALDDFGAGYSSLSQLTSLPIEYLKLDITLVSQINNSDKKQKTYEAVCKLGKQLGVKVVTEGVETKEELAIVSEMGADLVQGYVINRPQSEDALFKN